MAKRAGEPPLVDLPVEVGGLPAAHDVDEVLHESVLPRKLAHHLTLTIVSGGFEIFRRHDAAALAFDHVADADAAKTVHRLRHGFGGFSADFADLAFHRIIA